MADAKIKAVITADDNASRTLSKFGKNAGASFGKMAGAVAVGTAAARLLEAGLKKVFDTLKDVVNTTVDYTKQTLMLQRNFGLTAEKASTLVAIFNRFGMTAEDASKSLTIFQKQMLEANKAGGMASTTIGKLGIKVKGADGHLRDMNSVLLDVADKFKNDIAVTERAAYAKELFGRAGLKLLPILLRGRDGIQELIEKAEKYGLVLSQDNVDAVMKYVGAQKDLSMAWTGLKLTIGNIVLPALAQLYTKFAEFLSTEKFRKWVTDTTKQLATDIPIWIEKVSSFIKSIDWEQVKNNTVAIATAIVAMGNTIGGTINNINIWLNRFIALGGRVLFEWQNIINNIKVAWRNLKASIIATGQGIYANIYKYLIDPIARVIAWIQRAVAKFASMHPAVAKALAGIGASITAPFRPAFNFILGMISRIESALGGLKAASDLSGAVKNISAASTNFLLGKKKATGTDFFTPRKYATGTSGAYGGNALVGERGPEMVTLPRGSKVSRADETRKMMGGVSNINISINAGAYLGSQQEARKHAKVIYQALVEMAGMKGQTLQQLIAGGR